MKTIPQFPEEREILLEDKPLFDSIFHSWQPEVSAYTFTNIFAWRKPYSARLSMVNDLLIVSHLVNGKLSLMEPMGNGDKVKAVHQCLKTTNVETTFFDGVSGALAKELEPDDRLTVVYDRNNADYLYKSDDLINLAGRKFDGKRTFVSRFKQKYDYEYIKLSADNVEACHSFAEQWCDDKACDASEGLSRERCAVYEMLSHFAELGICGGSVWVDGRVIAFSLGEALNKDTMVIHVEKGDTSLDGVYQLINNEFCTHEAQNYEFVNREQDLGIPGLRKAKESYQPVKLVDSFRVSLR
jgi:hypothetical protein